MYINNETNKKMINLAQENNEQINADNFSFYSSQCLIEEFIAIMEERKCSINDINNICTLLPQMLLNLEVKKESIKLPSF